MSNTETVHTTDGKTVSIQHAAGSTRNAVRRSSRPIEPISALCYRLPNQRTFDLDMYGVCNQCSRLLYVIEAFSTPTKIVTQTVQFGDAYGVPAYAIHHLSGDSNLEHPIDIHVWYPDGTDRRVDGTSWEALEKSLNYLRTKHECTQRKPRHCAF